MRIRRTTAVVTVVGVLSLAAGVAAGGGTAHAATIAATPAAARSTSFVTDGVLYGVAATSAGNAWAVGYTGTGANEKTLIVRWNGKAWVKPAGFTPAWGELSGISAVSATSAWAVGYTAHASIQRTLLMHWNGKTWATVTAVKPVNGSFTTVTATAESVWVAGATTSAQIGFWPQSLIWHWNGKTWTKTAAPAVTEGAFPEGFAVTGTDSVWLGGLGNVNAQISDMLMHWNGRSWSLAKFPLYGVYEMINAMAAGPKGTAWAVGSDTGTSPGAISMYFNGKGWAKTSGPANAKTSLFGAVAAVPGGGFGAPGYVRFSYATSEERIAAGIAAIRGVVEKAWQVDRTGSTKVR